MKLLYAALLCVLGAVNLALCVWEVQETLLRWQLNRKVDATGHLMMAMFCLLVTLVTLTAIFYLTT